MLRLIFETVGAHALLAAAVLAYRGRSSDPTRFAEIAAIGAFYLYLDDTLDLHVWLADLFYDGFGWRPPPGINHFDDLIVMVTALTALAVLAWHRSEVLRDAVFAGLFGAGLVTFAFAIVVDAAWNPSLTLSWWTEEVSEFVGSAFMAAAFYRRWKWPMATFERNEAPAHRLLAGPIEGGDRLPG